MDKKTLISGIVLLSFCGLLGISLSLPSLWSDFLPDWISLPAVALVMTLLVGLVLMDSIFELGNPLVIRLRIGKLKLAVSSYLVGALLVVCAGSMVVEMMQFFLFPARASWFDPPLACTGAVAGIFLHIMGSRWLRKRVEFELERWEDNVL